MQLLSLAILGPEAQRLAAEFRQIPALANGETIAAAVGIAFLVAIVAAWIGGQLVAKERASFSGAIVTAFLWLLGLAIALPLTGFALYFAKLRGSETMTMVSLGIGALLVLYVSISAPMRGLKVNFFKAFAIALVALIVQTAACLGIMRLSGDPLALAARARFVQGLAALPASEAAELLKTTRTLAPTTTAPRTIEERHADLKRMYEELQARRETLREGDEAALLAYQRDSDRYVKLLTELQRDAAAQTGPMP